jgi:phosphatidylserine/phosphatidylglycerophosphate/cardiolipin synthase-like enzyme
MAKNTTKKTDQKTTEQGEATQNSSSKNTIMSVIVVVALAAVLLIADLLGIVDVNWNDFFQSVISGEEAPPATMPVSSSESGEPETVTEPVTAVEPSASGGWYSLYFNSPQYPDEEATRVHTIRDGLIEAINSAEETLDISIYELDLEEVGDAILAAEERGVEVRIVTDSDTIEEDETLIRLHEEKVPMVEDDRSAIMHNKFMVVDGKAVWTGSYNFTRNGTYRNNNNAIFIQSPELAANFSVEFAEQFEDGKFGPRSPENTVNPEVEIEGTLIETCFAPEDECGLQIAELLFTAENSIHFMAFSFTHDDMGEVIRERADEGVLVRGVFEIRSSETDYSEFYDMLKDHLDVYQDGNPYVMHHKVFIIDESIVIMGSFNFSTNADESNDENILIIHNTDIADEYMKEFDRVYDLAENKPYSKD